MQLLARMKFLRTTALIRPNALAPYGWMWRLRASTSLRASAAEKGLPCDNDLMIVRRPMPSNVCQSGRLFRLVVFVTDVLLKVEANCHLRRTLRRPWLSVGAGVINGNLDCKMPFINSPISLDYM
jgi:hypothetical protein